MTDSECKGQLHPTTTTLIQGVLPSGLCLSIRSAKRYGNPIKLKPEKNGGRACTPRTNPDDEHGLSSISRTMGTWLDSKAILPVATLASIRKRLIGNALSA